MTAEQPAQPKPRRWPRIRYSLRTLLLFVLLAGSGMGLWFRWEPWYVVWSDTISSHNFGISDFSPDGNLLLASDAKEFSNEGDILVSFQILNAATGQTMWSFSNPYGVSCNGFLFPSFSPNGKWVLVNCRGDDTGRGEYFVFRTSDGQRISLPLKESKPLFPASFSPDGNWLLTNIAYDVCAIELQTLRTKTIVKGGYSHNHPCSAQWANDGHSVVTTGANYENARESFITVSVWNFDNGTLEWTLTGRNQASGSDVFVVGPHTVVVGFPEKLPATTAHIRIFDLKTKAVLDDLDGQLTYACAFGDGLLFGIGKSEMSNPPVLLLVRSQTGAVRELGYMEDNLAANVESVITKDRFLRIKGNNTGSPRWFDMLTGYECARFGVRSADGTFLATLHRNCFQVLDPQGSVLFEKKIDSASIQTSEIEPLISSRNQILTQIDNTWYGLWSRRRPEQWWGIAWLPEFWLTLIFGCGLVWSVWRDRRELPGRTGEAKA